MSVIVTGPGVYRGMPESVYHADPIPEGSLSNSGAKLILESPARFRWAMDNPTTKRAFDFGKAAHAEVLGTGALVVTVPTELCAKNGAWSTTDAKEFISKSQAAGLTVLKPEDLTVIADMAEALREHPIVRLLLKDGDAEGSYFWRDPETSVMMRARMDWMTRLPGGRPCIVDYKTTGRSANPARFGWEARDYGYHMQDVCYREAADILVEPGHAFLFIVQEKTAPYLVSVCEMDDDLRDVGAQRHRVARRLYLDCRTRDEWPGYAPIVHTISARADDAPEPIGVTT